MNTPKPKPSVPVTPDMTVREVLTRYPALGAVFDKHGMAGCGGPDGPQEPLGFFAAVHHVDPVGLLAELNQEVSRQRETRTRPSPAAPQMAATQVRTYPLFLRTSVVLALTAGFTLGAILLLARTFGMPAGTGGFGWWFTHVQLHGFVQIFGWMGLFTMGVALHVVPRLKAVTPFGRTLPLMVYGLVVAGVLLRVAAQPFGPGAVRDFLILAGGGSLLLGSGAFAGAILRVLRQTQRPSEGFEPYLVAAAIWLVLGALAQLVQMAYLVLRATIVVPDAYNEPVLHILLVGFLGLFAMGISLRLLPAFLGVPNPSRRVMATALALVNSGLALRTVAAAGVSVLSLTDLDPIVRIGTLAEAAGFGVFAFAVWPWRRGRLLANLPMSDASSGYRKFVQAAYLWLVVTAVVESGLALRALGGTLPTYLEVSAGRHALALGFLTLLAMGIALRVVPVFGGTQLAWPRLGDAAFWLVLTSVTLRVGFSLGSAIEPAISAGVVGLSGLLGTAGLLCWSAAIWRTLDRSDAPARHQERTQTSVARPAPVRPAPVRIVAPVSLTAAAKAAPGREPSNRTITGNMCPGDVVEHFPATLAVFLRFGFEALSDENMRATVGRTVTIEQAARMHGVNPEHLCAELNQAAGSPRPSPH